MVSDVMRIRRADSPQPPLTKTYGQFSRGWGYRAQESYAKAMAGRGQKVAGYKLAYASDVEREAWGIAEPVYARLYAGQRVPDGGTVALADYRGFHAEPEVAFVMARRLAAPRDLDEVLAAVRSVHPALELPDMRYDAEAGQLHVVDVIAEGAGSHRFVLGPGRRPGEVDVDTLTGVLTHDGEEVARGRTAELMGGPWRALWWLAHKLDRRGHALQAGDVVLTGSVTRPHVPADGAAAGKYVAKFPGLGQAGCTVVPGKRTERPSSFWDAVTGG